MIPKDRAYLSMKVVQGAMDEHAKRVAILFGEWLLSNDMAANIEELYDKFIKTIKIPEHE